MITERYLSDLSDQDLVICPVPEAHCVAWQLGHLICSERKMLEGVAQQGVRVPELPELPAGFEQRHAKDKVKDKDKDKDIDKDAVASGEADPAGNAFPSKSTYEALMRSLRAATVATLEGCGEEQLSLAGPEAMRGYAPTVGSVLCMIGTHELMHSGQIAVLRRKLGKPVVI
jgi:hypothetical protein